MERRKDGRGYGRGGKIRTDTSQVEQAVIGNADPSLRKKCRTTEWP